MPILVWTSAHCGLYLVAHTTYLVHATASRTWYCREPQYSRMPEPPAVGLATHPDNRDLVWGQSNMNCYERLGNCRPMADSDV
jgi:hypothetical protein